jgi:hypothetical protein
MQSKGGPLVRAGSDMKDPGSARLMGRGVGFNLLRLE